MYQAMANKTILVSRIIILMILVSSWDLLTIRRRLNIIRLINDNSLGEI